MGRSLAFAHVTPAGRPLYPHPSRGWRHEYGERLTALARVLRRTPSERFTPDVYATEPLHLASARGSSLGWATTIARIECEGLGLVRGAFGEWRPLFTGGPVAVNNPHVASKLVFGLSYADTDALFHSDAGPREVADAILLYIDHAERAERSVTRPRAACAGRWPTRTPAFSR